MKASVVLWIGLLSALPCQVHAQFQAGANVDLDVREADLVVMRGQILTGDGWVEAMAVRDGVIIALGDDASMDTMITDATEVIDVTGDTVLPGLHDMHVHPLIAGVEKFACRLEPGASPESIADTVEDCAAKMKPGEWISGGNWVAAVFAPGQQDREFLDAVAPDNPVFLYDESHHSAWVNSMALELAGISRDTANPQGGIIERDANGEPNGLLRESANGLVAVTIPEATEAVKREGMRLAANEMLSHGITSFAVAYVTPWQIQTLSDLSGNGVMKQRVRACINWSASPEEARATQESLIEARARFASERLKMDCVKIMLDGVPTESHTAVMLEPYVDAAMEEHDERPEKGILMVQPDELARAVTRFDAQGLHLKIHVAGDGAVRAAIDAVEVARKANGFGGPAHHVSHNSFVDKADIPRVRELQMSWEFSPYIWYPTPIMMDISAAVGPARMDRAFPIREALESGALVTAGSDWPVVPLVNPWIAVETMVTRRKPGGGADAVGEEQGISLEDAIQIMTENGARLMGHRDRVGSIDVGMLADFIVTDMNPFEVPITDVHRTTVRMTFINGEKVYDSTSPLQTMPN